MLKFYMDESSLGKNADEKVCSIGGFVMQNSSWKTFHKQWRKVLQEFDLDEFKSKEFWDRSPDGGLCGKYRNWSFDDANSFIIKLLGLIVSYKPFLLAGVVKIPDFFACSLNERRWLTGARYDVTKKKFITSGRPQAAYFSAFNVVVTKGVQHGKDKKQLCHFVFDEQKEFAPYALQRLAEIRRDQDAVDLVPYFGESLFSESIKVCPLQAADLAAYVTKKYHEKTMFGEAIDRPDRAVITPMDALELILKSCQHMFYPVGKVEIDKMLAKSLFIY